MVESSVIREMLDELRFDEAEKLLEEANGENAQSLREEINSRRAKAQERGMTVAQRVIELGEAQNLEEIVALAHEQTTQPLVKLTPETYRRRAELYLREAKRWEERQKETNARRLTEARRALSGLDLELARGLMKKIDGRFLSQEQEEERDQLLLDISARAMEIESLSETGDSLIQREKPRHEGPRRQPWWRRWFG